jgi:pimeloyl-ACP methyl ester carboxylesterase
MSQPAVGEWEARGHRIEADGRQVFVLDAPPTGPESGDPLFVLHGFPTCSFDWRHVIEPVRAAGRRVVLFDLPGFGLSDKPDLRYRIRMYADTAEVVAKHARLERVVLVTHDLGDSVGGELLTRALEGTPRFDVTNRIITNGSIYMDLVALSQGQQMLLDAPDERIDLAALGIDPAAGFKAGIAGTFANPPTAEELDAQWELASYQDGHQLLPRTIRYVEDRRAEESRYTGGIEQHASPLHIVWGKLDPIARYPMAERLHERVRGSTLVTLEEVGHYPMVEDPAAFTAAMLDALSSPTQ